MRQLTVEPEFENKIPPLSADEFSRLEANILEDGEVREPIVIWGNTIIDGHNRWKIIQKHPELNWSVKQMDFPDKWAAIAWMCRNQLGRRNLTDEQKSYLLGKQYEAQKHCEAFRGNQYSGCLHNEDNHPGRTKDKMAKEVGISATTIERAERFAKGLDAAEEASPGIREVILSGGIKVPKIVVSEIRNLSDEQKKEVSDAIKAGEVETAKEVIRQSREEPAETADQPVLKDEAIQEDCCNEFTIEDLCSLVDSAIDNLDISLEMHLVSTNHLEPLYCEAGRRAVSQCLHKGHSVIEKYMNLLKGMKDRGK